MILLLLAGFFMLTACSGTRSTTTEQAPRFADQQLQEQVDDLVDKVNSNPENSEFRQQLANLYHQNGRSMDALKVLEEGLQLDPNDLETKYAYAEIASQIGERRRAYTAYKEILQSSYGNDYLDRIAPKFSDGQISFERCRNRTTWIFAYR